MPHDSDAPRVRGKLLNRSVGRECEKDDRDVPCATAEAGSLTVASSDRRPKGSGLLARYPAGDLGRRSPSRQYTRCSLNNCRERMMPKRPKPKLRFLENGEISLNGQVIGSHYSRDYGERGWMHIAHLSDGRKIGPYSTLDRLRHHVADRLSRQGLHWA